MRTMKTLLGIAVACVSYITLAQAAGITWTTGLSFEQVKQENKYIFSTAIQPGYLLQEDGLQIPLITA